MTELTAKHVKQLDTAVLRVVDLDLCRLIPERQRELQKLQRSHVWVRRELKARRRGSECTSAS